MAGAALATAATAPAAEAHGLAVRADLPIPEWLFGWAAAGVLVVSFIALAALWPRPLLEEDSWRPLPGAVGRAPASRPVGFVCGLIGVVVLALVIWSGLAGSQTSSANFAPTFVYLIFWVGLVPVSVLLGDVFRAFNPWRAIGRAAAAVGNAVSRDGLPAPLPYPERLGRWPAATGLLLFTVLELVADTGDTPRAVAIAALAYTALTLIAMTVYGVEQWIDRGEAFSVYFNLFSRMGVLEARDRVVGVRRALSGLAALPRAGGTVALLSVMIGTVTFDGLSNGALWNALVPALQDLWGLLGLGPARTLELTFATGLVACILIVFGFYRLGVAGAESVGGGFRGRELAQAFVHSLVPIALAYVLAHYVSLLVVQGQAIGYLVSDPLGRGWNLLGTAEATVDYGVVGQQAYWYMQVGFVVAGHVAGLMLAHDRALAMYSRAREAVRSQYWMLGVMVGFTSLALWLLASANQA